MLMLTKNRKIVTVAAFAAVMVGLGIGQAFLQEHQLPGARLSRRAVAEGITCQDCQGV